MHEEPNLTFYEDHSGVRENYWHVEGSVDGKSLVFNVAAKSGHMFELYSDSALGHDMGLTEIPYERMGEEEYDNATRKLFEALFGEGSVVEVQYNAISDSHYCNMGVVMSDGTSYDLEYEDGLITECMFVAVAENDRPWSSPNWAADWLYVNMETGETFNREW